MTAAPAERRLVRSSALFSVRDAFVILRGVDGPAAARYAQGPLTFQLTAIGSGPGRRSLDPGWMLPVIQGASGMFISDGTIADPVGRRSRPVGPPLDIELTAVGPAYRAAPLQSAPGAPPPAGPRLVNLDPSQPTVAVTPFPVELRPGYNYPFPDSPYGYSLLRGEVLHGPAGAGVDQAPVNGTAGTWTDTYVTDSTGQWVFTLPDARAGPVTIVARDQAGNSVSTTVTVKASTTIAVPALIIP